MHGYSYHGFSLEQNGKRHLYSLKLENNKICFFRYPRRNVDSAAFHVQYPIPEAHHSGWSPASSGKALPVHSVLGIHHHSPQRISVAPSPLRPSCETQQSGFSRKPNPDCRQSMVPRSGRPQTTQSFWEQPFSSFPCGLWKAAFIGSAWLVWKQTRANRRQCLRLLQKRHWRTLPDWKWPRCINNGCLPGNVVASCEWNLPR